VLVVRRTYPACVELLTIDPPDHRLTEGDTGDWAGSFPQDGHDTCGLNIRVAKQPYHGGARRHYGFFVRKSEWNHVIFREEQQSVATPHAARGRVRPPCRHSKIQSCCFLGSAFEVAAFQTLAV
jgi:hypothetical protein